MKKTLLLAGVAASLALAATTGASAQSIDYGSLEQMFNEPVTTSATGSPQRASQAPVDMDIITAADIERSGATDLPTILSRVPGLDILPWSAGSADIGVRGYDTAMSPRLLVLVNGRQVYLDFYGYTAWSTLPVRLEEIRQIEVVKGPNAALFGFNAVSGVINIITYNPKYDNKSFVTGRVGAHDYKEASAGGTFKFGDRFAGRLSGGVSKQDEFKNSLAGMLASPSRATANIDTVTELADKLELRVEGGWAHSLENVVPAGSGYHDTKYVTSDVKGTLNWDTQIGALQASAYQNRVTAKFAGNKTINKIEVVSAQDLFKIGADHTFRVSAEYRKTDMPVAGDSAKIEYDVKSLAGMWNWQALSKLAVTAAARYDDLDLKRTGGFPAGLAGVTNAVFDRRITLPSYNAGVVWTATDMDTVRATYARGSQIPSLSGLGSLFPIGPGMIYGGSPTLEPTIVTNYGLSYDRALPQIGGSASVRVFYQKSKDITGLPDFAHPDIATPTLTVFTYANVSDSKMKGVEAVMKGSYTSGVRWNANYAYTDVKDSPFAAYNTTAILSGKAAAYALTTPKHRANLNVGWDNAQWSVDGFVRYQSKFEMNAETTGRGALQTVGSYGTLAARVARKFDQGFTVAVSGQGLTQSRQRQTSGIEADRRVFLTLSKTW